MYPGMSEKRMIPQKTMQVPTQWATVKGFWKYQIENNNDRNFLKVRTSDAVRLGHSVVGTKTAECRDTGG